MDLIVIDVAQCYKVIRCVCSLVAMVNAMVKFKKAAGVEYEVVQRDFSGLDDIHYFSGGDAGRHHALLEYGHPAYADI